MELLEDSIWILSALELDLCFHILDLRQLSILPVEDTEDPLDHRMLNGFLHLAQLGLLEPAESGYRPTALLIDRMRPITSADVLFTLMDDRNPLAVFCADDRFALLTPTGDAAMRYALGAFPLTQLEQALEPWCSAASGDMIELTMLTPENDPLSRELIPRLQIDTVPARIRALWEQITTDELTI